MVFSERLDGLLEGTLLQLQLLSVLFLGFQLVRDVTNLRWVKSINQYVH